MTTPTVLRQQVLDLRIRLERAAAQGFDEVCAPRRRGVQQSIAKRLIFLVGTVDSARQPEVHRLAHLGGQVYKRTSDVLHGRMNALDLSDVVVAEWRTVVEALEAVLES